MACSLSGLLADAGTVTQERLCSASPTRLFGFLGVPRVRCFWSVGLVGSFSPFGVAALVAEGVVVEPLGFTLARGVEQPLLLLLTPLLALRFAFELAFPTRLFVVCEAVAGSASG